MARLNKLGSIPRCPIGDTMKDVYDSLYSEDRYAGIINHKQANWLLKRPLAGIKTAVDFGCGPGHTVKKLRAHGIDTTGVDFSTTLKERFWSGDDKFIQGDITSTDLDDTFDLVVCHDVLEHLAEEDATKALDTLAKHTNGFVSLVIANHSDVWLGKELHINNQPYDWWKNLVEERWEILESQSPSGRDFPGSSFPKNQQGILHLFWCKKKD